MGKLYVVGFGCGSREGMTLEAERAIGSSDLIVGYTTYINILKEFFPEKRYAGTGMRGETRRVDIAIAEARSGKTVSLVCSGDPEVYGMAGLALERSVIRAAGGGGPEEEGTKGNPGAGSGILSGSVTAGAEDAEDTEGMTGPGGMEGCADIDIEIIPGVTAALSSGALLGAPLANDFAVISLSDLMTPAERIEKRLRAAALGDFNIVLYNPASKQRPHHLGRACGILLEYLSPDTVCGYARNTGRSGEEHGVMTLSELSSFEADMFTTIFIGNSETIAIGGRMAAPRGYRNE